MTFTTQIWQERTQKGLSRLKQWLQKGDAAYLAYGTVAGLSLWPLVEAAAQAPPGQPLPVSLYLALGSLAGSVGSNLIAEQLQRWRDRAGGVTEPDVAQWVAENAASNAELRQAVDDILAKLGAVDTAVHSVPTSSTVTQPLAGLVKIVAAYFDREELRSLCFELGVNYDDLPAEGRVYKVRELVSHLARRRRLDELVAIGRRLRSGVDWPDIAVVPDDVEAALGEAELVDRDWLAATLRQEMARLGNLERFGPIIDSAVAVGKRSIAAAGDVKAASTGDHSPVTYVETQVINQGVLDMTRLSPADLRTAYLNRLVKKAGQLSLAGVDPKAATGGEVDTSLNLGAVYTALLTQTTEDVVYQEKRVLAAAGRKISALDQLNGYSRLVLLGDPGSGKSTFVNFVATCLAGELLGRDDVNLTLLTSPLPNDEGKTPDDARPQRWEHGPLLPVRVILRDFAARGLPPAGEKACADHLWRFIAADLQEASLADYAPQLRRELMTKGGLLLLDGLDEVPEADRRREQIKQAVTDFAATFERCRLLVTSRTYAYQKQEWRLPGFAETILASFSQGQIHRFIDSWYAHVAVVRGLAKEDARGRAALLKHAVFGSDRLQGLAERPLLLTLMASLHAWRGGSLPEKREELYADAVDLLLDQWESPKMVRDAAGNPVVQQPSLAEWLNIDRAKMRQLLNRLAYEAHTAQPDLVGTADIPEGDLVAGLLHLSPQQDLRPRPLMNYLSQRAGLLLSRGEGVYTFPHRTFQEYLAACHLTDDEFPDKLADLAQQDPNRWREVALLAGAKAVRGSASFVWALAEALCFTDPVGSDDLSRRGEPTEVGTTNEADAWGAHLAGQFLAETADLSDLKPQHMAKVDRVQRWLVHLLRRGPLPATERALAGVSLAQLGDPRRELLDVDRMPLCLVPGGDFWMGSDEEEREKPLHLNKHFAYDYWLGCYPVTNAQYDAFVADGGYRQRAYWPEAEATNVWRNGQVRRYFGSKDYDDVPYDFGRPFNLANHPVVGISWYEALAFCRWLTDRWRAAGWLSAGWEVRLPSEAEWEKGARGGLMVPVQPVVADVTTFLTVGMVDNAQNPAPQRRFPWGDEDIDNQANVEAVGISASSTPGCFPQGASPYGCEEMVGNVYEWTRSLWGKSYSEPDHKYPYRPDDGREDLASKEWRVVRGGSFGSGISYIRCPARLRYNPSDPYWYNGVRVAVAPSSSTSDR